MDQSKIENRKSNIRPLLALAIGLAVSSPAASADPASAPAIPVTGAAVAGMESFDKLMVDFLAATKAPGAALAVGREGKLLYARGFGWADREARQPVQPDSLFRIASLSKPVTAVAVLQLVDAGRLGLDDRVSDILKLPSGELGDPRWRTVTVRQLLQHTGGLDNRGGDVMFLSRQIARARSVQPPPGPWDVIRYRLALPLDFDPGSRYAYSNFGYCLLGRVIEKVTGQPYQDHVRSAVLRPCGATGMRLGRSLAEHRSAGEVRYYSFRSSTGPSVFGRPGQTAPGPYGTFCLEAMDAHGGWLAGAGDLVKFAMALDRPAGPGEKALLSPRAMERMLAPPHIKPPGSAPAASQPAQPTVYYGCGWLVRRVGKAKVNAWHLGGLCGTSTLLVRRHDGWTWAALFNSDLAMDGQWLAGHLDRLVHPAADQAARCLARPASRPATTRPGR